MITYDSATDARGLGKVIASWHVQVPFINDPVRPVLIWVMRSRI